MKEGNAFASTRKNGQLVGALGLRVINIVRNLRVQQDRVSIEDRGE
jgi:hypothetical protein